MRATLTKSRMASNLLCLASQAANLTEEQFSELWQGYIDTAATCLLQANNDVDSPAGQHLVRMKGHAYELVGIDPHERVHLCCALACLPACASVSFVSACPCASFRTS